jgi:hypothetical protein
LIVVFPDEYSEIEGAARKLYGPDLFSCDQFSSELVIKIQKNVELLKTTHRCSSLELIVDLEHEQNHLYIFNWADERC